MKDITKEGGKDFQNMHTEENLPPSEKLINCIKINTKMSMN